MERPTLSKERGTAIKDEFLRILTESSLLGESLFALDSLSKIQITEPRFETPKLSDSAETIKKTKLEFQN